MNSNVYVRSNRSIKTISLTRIAFLLPLIIYGIYKNGIYLYKEGYTNLFGLFKPIILIIIGAFIGALVNIIYECYIKKRKDKLINILFSSFHIEWGIILACLSSINVNILVFSIVTFIILFLSKLFKVHFNIMSIIFILIYFIQMLLYNNYNYLNIYEQNKTLSLNFMDYLIGRGPGGIACTHIILLIIAIVGLYFTNSNKTNITISSIITLIILFTLLSLYKNISLSSLLFNNNYLFIMTFVATDSYTSCYTVPGELIYGILVGILTFMFYFINPIIAPYIAITIVSLFNVVIDKKANSLIKN